VAALEKKAALDTVNFTGDARFRFGSEKATYYALSEGIIIAPVVSSGGTAIPHGGSSYLYAPGVYGQGLYTSGGTNDNPIATAPADAKNNTFMRYRVRLNVSAPVADNISFNARLTMEKNAGVNSNGSSNSNPIYASLTGYNDDSNTLYVERSYITWTLNPYPVTFVLGRLPTMDSGAYYSNLFMDTGTEGGMI
ncbi:MAG: DUF3373 family protein, partial [Thermodesulfobium sp.]